MLDKGKEKKKKPCQGHPHDLICEDINEWMKELTEWADSFRTKFNELATAVGGGDPTGVPPPPEPPFE